MKHLRLSEDQLSAIQQRLGGRVVTHRLEGSEPKNKYRNKKTEVAGEKFDSQKEARRCGELRILEGGGRISDLKRQVHFPIRINEMLVCTYVADFTYTEAGKQVVEDSKGYRTQIYLLKKKLMKAVHGIEIKET